MARRDCIERTGDAVLFRRRQPAPGGGVTPPAGDGTEEDPGAHPSPSLTKALDRVFRKGRPEILDLGPFCGATVVQLAERGARVQVDPFVPPEPTPARKPGEPPPVPSPLVIEQPDERFDLVIAWEQIDFVPPERLADFGTEVARVLATGGWLLALSLARGTGDSDGPVRYRLSAGGGVIREPAGDPPRRRWVHPNREIERAMTGLSLQGIHLQRNQMREFLWLKREPREPRH